MKSYQKILAVITLSSMCLAAPLPSDSDVAARKSKKHHAAKAEEAKPVCEACEAIKQLKEQLAAQQAEIDQLKGVKPQAAGTTDAAAEAAAAAAQQQAAAAAAAAAEANAKATAAQADIASAKAEANTAELDAADAKKRVADLEMPAYIHFKGIRITPGGYFDVTGYFRQYTNNSGPATQFNATPLHGVAVNGPALANQLSGVGGLSEFGASARATRLSVRADADAGSTKLTGYFEGDFFGNTLATPNQTTAFGMRIRQGWGRAKFANGWTITGGQMWNDATMSRKGTDADTPWVPNTIDSNYLVGFNWGRQAELRISKSINKATLSLGLIDPSYISTGATPSVVGLVGGGAGNLGNTVEGCTVQGVCGAAIDTYSTNLAPDIAVKLAYDSEKLGHFEVKGLQRFFRDRVPATSSATHSYNNVALGYGVGGGMILHLVPRKADFVAQGMWGEGISRYEGANASDFVVRSAGTLHADDFNLQPIQSWSAIVGFETHPTPRFEFNLWGGDEHYSRSIYPTNAPGFTPVDGSSTPVAGYGVVNGASTRNLMEGTAVVWYDVYKGSFGTLRYGAQYEYIYRATWNVGPERSATGNNNVGMLSMRYIIP